MFRRAVRLIAILLCVAHVAPATTEFFEHSYAIVIGIDNYQSPSFPKLTYAVKDAQAITDYLQSQGYDKIFTLYNEQASKQNILEAMQNLVAPRVKANDRVLVFFAGHGYTENLGGKDRGYIVPFDGGKRSASYISMEELETQSSYMGNARHQLFIMDSCYGGLLSDTRASLVPSTVPEYLNEVSKRSARQVITAGGPGQQVLDGGPKGHSYFVDYLLEALQDGMADLNRDGYITFDELSAYLIPRASNRYQTPSVGILPGHGAGEYLFRSPATVAVARSAETAVLSGPLRGVDNAPGDDTSKGFEPSAASRTKPFSGKIRDIFRQNENEWDSSGDSPIVAVQLELVRTIKQQTPTDRARGLAFSPDGTLLAAAWQQVEHNGAPPFKFTGNGSIRLWNVETGELVRTLKAAGDQRSNDMLEAVAFSPDGRTLAASTSVNGPSVVQLWDLGSGDLLDTLSAKDSMRKLTFSPDGELLAAACDDGSVHLWKTDTHQLVKTLKHPYIVVSVAFNPQNSAILAAGDYKQSVRVWNLTTGSQPRVLYSTPPSYGEAVAFSPDGKTLATGHANGDLITWGAGTWAKSHTMRYQKPGDGTGIDSVAFSPDGKLLAAASGEEVLRFWDPDRGTILGTFDISDHSASTNYNSAVVAFNPRRHLLATTISGDFIQIWKLTVTHSNP